MLCGDVQSVAIYAGLVTASTGVRLRWVFQAYGSEGFESYGIAVSNQTVLQSPNVAPGASITVTLDGVYDDIQNWNAFISQYQNDVANFLEIDPSRVIVVSVMSGSIIVNTRVLDVPSESVPASQLVANLQTAINNNSVQALGGYPVSSASVSTSSSTGGVSSSSASATGTGSSTSTPTSSTAFATQLSACIMFTLLSALLLA